MRDTRCVGLEIRKVSNLFRRNLESRLTPAEVGVTGMQRMVLRFLAEHADREIYQRDIESFFSIRRSTATGMLQLMEKNGLLVRQSVSSDARLKKLELTPAGTALYRKTESDIQAMEHKAVLGMTAAEVDQFFLLLGKIQKNLEL